MKKDNKNNLNKIVALAALGILGTTVATRSCSVVPAGYVTVLDTFGSVNPSELESGLHFPINPFSTRIEIETRTKERKENLKIPTREGLMAGLDISILYKINPQRADEIYKNLGTEYADVFLIPTLRNITRDVVANYSSEDLYSPNRTAIASVIMKQLGKEYASRGIILENVLLRDVTLPPEVTAAIDRKISAKQTAESMEYVLAKETKESERKKIEAQGITDAQQIISQSLTAEYLQWKYVTTLGELASSNNTTFVITPFDQKLVPYLPLKDEKK